MHRVSFRIGMALAALFFSSLPYIYGALQPVSGSTYTGIRPLNASDYNVNLSWLQQFREGRLLLNNLYSSEPQRAFLIRPVYCLISLPFRFLSISNTAALHILRLLCGFALLLALFPMLQSITNDSRVTIITFALLAFTSGAGLLFRSVFPQSIDLSVPESVLFLALGEPPHFLYSLLLLWGGVLAFYHARNDSKFLLLYLMCLSLLWWEHPFDAVTLIFVGAVELWILPRWNRFLIPVGIAAVSLPPLLYYRALQKFPDYAGWSIQNVMLTPSAGSLISGFLPLILLAIPAAFFLRRDPERRRIALFLLLWVVTQCMLSYLPFSFQRRLTAGMQFPLAILAAFTLNRWKMWAPIAATILLLTASNVYMTQQQIEGIASKDMPFYLPDSYARAFQWLAAQKDKGTVMSGFITGNFIPAYTGHPVYMGHSALTPQIARKRAEASGFYRNPQPDFLKGNGIQYVFWGREEQRLSGKNLESVFSSGYNRDGIAIFSADTLNKPEIARFSIDLPVTRD